MGEGMYLTCLYSKQSMYLFVACLALSQVSTGTTLGILATILLKLYATSIQFKCNFMKNKNFSENRIYTLTM